MTAGKKESQSEINARKKSRRIAIIVISTILIVAAGGWYAMRYFAPITEINHVALKNGEKLYIVCLLEKTNEYNHKNPTNDAEWQSGIRHYGYFLELTDSSTHQVLDNISFDSPVQNITRTPELICLEDNSLWVLCAADPAEHDSHGYIMKFTLQSDKIVKSDFNLAEQYRVQEWKSGKVFLTEGTALYHGYNPVFGGIYLDLSTGQIVNERPSDQ